MLAHHTTRQGGDGTGDDDENPLENLNRPSPLLAQRQREIGRGMISGVSDKPAYHRPQGRRRSEKQATREEHAQEKPVRSLKC